MGLVRSTSRSRRPRIAETFFYCTTLIFSPEDVGTSHLRIFGSYLPVNMASHFRGLDFTKAKVKFTTVHESPQEVKGKEVPLQAWKGPEGSRTFRLPDFITATQDDKAVSLTHLPPLPPGNTPDRD